MGSLSLEIGVKTDPVAYRFSYEWLFRLLAEDNRISIISFRFNIGSGLEVIKNEYIPEKV